jgi:hypothetical protein
MNVQRFIPAVLQGSDVITVMITRTDALPGGSLALLLRDAEKRFDFFWGSTHNAYIEPPEGVFHAVSSSAISGAIQRSCIASTITDYGEKGKVSAGKGERA